MDEKQFAKRDFHVGGASGIEVTTDFLSADYQLSEPKRDVTTGSTGCLELFRIDPIRAGHGQPSFRVRIGHDDHEAVDVDLIGPEAECRAFAKAAPGYLGHKAQSLKTSPRSFRLDIAVHSVGRVFSGTITIKGLLLGVRGSVQGKAEVRGKVEAVKASDRPTEGPTWKRRDWATSIGAAPPKHCS